MCFCIMLIFYQFEIIDTSNNLQKYLTYLIGPLVKEGILQAVPEKKRHYQLGDIKDFLISIEELKAGHSSSGKPRAKAKAKAAPRITKSKKAPPKAQ